MKKTKHSEEKIIGAVKQLEAGRPVKEVAREMGVTDQTRYNWKAKFGGMEVSDAKKLRALEEETLCWGRPSGGTDKAESRSPAGRRVLTPKQSPTERTKRTDTLYARMHLASDCTDR